MCGGVRCSQQELAEKISVREPDLNAVLKCGSELRSHATKDDALRIDSSLKELSERYEALCKLNQTRIEQMKEIPEILLHFHEAHNNVLDWVQQIEAEMIQADVKPGIEAELRLRVCSES